MSRGHYKSPIDHQGHNGGLDAPDIQPLRREDTSGSDDCSSPPDADPATLASSELEGEEERRADYEVGYGKPPKHTQFRKGQSGNSKGRPPTSKNTATLLAMELDGRVLVTERGKRRSRTWRQVIIKQLVKKSAEADLKAMRVLFSMDGQVEAAVDERTVLVAGLGSQEEEILHGFIQRLRRDDDDDAG